MLKIAPLPQLADAEVVSFLEKLLGAAKEGKLKGIAVASVMEDGGILTAWKGAGVYRDVFRLLGGIQYLQFRFQSEQVESNKDKSLPWSS